MRCLMVATALALVSLGAFSNEVQLTQVAAGACKVLRPVDEVKAGYLYEWRGKCAAGLAEGPGYLRYSVGSVNRLVSEISFRAGKEAPPSVTYERWRASELMYRRILRDASGNTRAEMVSEDKLPPWAMALLAEPVSPRVVTARPEKKAARYAAGAGAAPCPATILVKNAKGEEVSFDVDHYVHDSGGLPNALSEVQHRLARANGHMESTYRQIAAALKCRNR